MAKQAPFFMKIFENEFMFARMEGDVFVGEYKSNILIDLDAAKKIIRFRNEITQNRKVKILIIIPSSVVVTPDAKKYFVDEGSESVEKFAFVNQSYFASLLGNAFLKIMAPKMPTKLFQTKNDALRWLNSTSSVSKNFIL